jgi:bacteriocin biosynthesis cyclodehydratase domain-containing protein
VEVFTASDGALYLLRPSTDDLMIQAPPTGAAMLLRSLDGTRTCEQLAAEFDLRDDVDVETAIPQLWALGLIEDASTDGLWGVGAASCERYDRQLAYFAELAPPGTHREVLQARLAAANVTVIGLGGLGCWTASALACTGVGRIVVVDGDVVDLSNLNRQILFTPADIGAGKALTGAQVLRSFNPGIDVVAISRRLEGEGDVMEAAEGSDVIVELADWPVGKLSGWIAAAANRLGIPHLQASQDPPVIRIGPTFIPGQTGCAECQARGYAHRHELYDELLAHHASRATEAATFGPACAIIGGLLANEIVNILLGSEVPATAGRAAIADLRTLEWSWTESIAAHPDCPICGGAPV